MRNYAFVYLLALLVAFCGIRRRFLGSASCAETLQPPSRYNPTRSAAPLSDLRTEVQSLRVALGRLVGEDPYIVIDTVHNRFQIRQGRRLLRDAACATGSGKALLNPAKRLVWHFETPRRPFRVQRKVRNPIWKKPEWAFVEQNRPVPVLPWEFRRLDPTALGKYALELGDGYEIHGTLYPSLLGRHITHGCIRLGDADLEAAFALMQTGSHVLIY